jgi:hypothetical protein
MPRGVAQSFLNAVAAPPLKPVCAPGGDSGGSGSSVAVIRKRGPFEQMVFSTLREHAAKAGARYRSTLFPRILSRVDCGEQQQHLATAAAATSKMSKLKQAVALASQQQQQQQQQQQATSAALAQKQEQEQRERHKRCMKGSEKDANEKCEHFLWFVPRELCVKAVFGTGQMPRFPAANLSSPSSFSPFAGAEHGKMGAAELPAPSPSSSAPAKRKGSKAAGAAARRHHRNSDSPGPPAPLGGRQRPQPQIPLTKLGESLLRALEQSHSGGAGGAVPSQRPRAIPQYGKLHQHQQPRRGNHRGGKQHQRA